MTCNYRTPRETRCDVADLAHWADSRETHEAVACAIHAIADDTPTPGPFTRTAAAIWEAPTAAEFEAVQMAVSEYVSRGDFAPEDDGRYPWGEETIRVLAPGTRVEAGKGEDHDTGRIIEIDGDMATVAWDSGVKTPCPLADLSRLD